MNKSKFLKKSLAALLAVMLVVAMVPLSAAAVFEPIIWVDDLEMDHTAGSSTYSVTKALADVKNVAITSNMLSSDGQLFAVVGEGVDKEERELVVDNGGQGIDLTKFATKSGNTYTLTVENRSDENDKDGVLEVVATYTLTITDEETPIDKETAISKVVHGDLYDPASYTIEGNTITMILPFGEGVPSDLTADVGDAKETFVPASKNATVKFTADATSAANGEAVGTIGTVLVSVDGGTKNYNVKVAYKDLFTNFSVENEVSNELTSKWAATVTNPAANEIVVTMPFGTATKTIVPTFTLGDSIKKIEYTNVSDTRTIVSGSTLPVYTGKDPSDNTSSANGNTDSSTAPTGIFRDLKVTRDDNTEITVKLSVIDQTANPNAKLTSVQIKGVSTEAGKDSNVIEFGDSTSATVQMPAGFQGPTADIAVKGSVGAKVQVKAQGIAEATVDANGDATLAGVTVMEAQKGKRIEIQVTSADGNTTARYYVTITVAPKAEAFLNSFILKDDTTKETYTINKWTTNTDGSYSGTLSVPYSYKLTDKLNALLAYANTSVGAKIKTSAVTTAASASTVNGKTLGTNWFTTVSDADDVFVDSKTATGLQITVSDNDDTQSNVYTIYFKAQAAKTAHGLRGLTLTAEDTYSQVTADNTYKTEISKLPTKANSKVSVDTVKVNVPYTFNAASTTAVYAYELKVDDGAVIMTDTNQLKAFDPEKYGDQSTDIKSIATTNWLTGVADGKVDTAVATPVYVVSEKAWVDKNATVSDVVAAIDSLVADKQASIYYVYGEKAKPETGSEILSIESTLDSNITATLDGARNVINLEVPYSYKDVAASAKEFTLNFSTSKLATVSAFNRAGKGMVGFKSDLGSSETTNATKFRIINNGSLQVNVALTDGTAANWVAFENDAGWSSGTPGVATLTVTAEDEVTTSTYTIKYTVADVQEGAELKQVKVANSTATPEGTTVNLGVPVGTVLNPQKLDLEVSKMATVKVNGTAWNPNTNYDLSTDVTIEVTSESGDNVNTYILKTTIDEGFSDVHESDWFFNEVTAAVNNGWIQGDGNGHFMPYGSMTRVQFATIIARMGGDFDPTDSEGCPFPDVEGAEAQAAAKYVAEKGIMQGDGDGFRPNDTITRQEAAIVLCKYKGIAPEDGATTYGDDATIADWAKGYVKAATTANIFEGNGDTFDPARQLRRCEGAAILVRSANK
ncbi:S-layer homology domain-containing protein [bacterium D16-76]|nr:S-layer homology domain-containing protein [bacterium D16-76]